MNGYNVAMSLRANEGEGDLERILEVFLGIPEVAPALVDWQIRVLKDPAGEVWAAFEGIVQARAPGTAAGLLEGWMEQARSKLVVAGSIPNQREASARFNAQVLA